ncbi:hypothetical protein MP228_010431 [Amoeboaphelidium protococcarum]|nr:hypothetical protein MP228_010431 [Amoeboaphelidium protococcarum]
MDLDDLSDDFSLDDTLYAKNNQNRYYTEDDGDKNMVCFNCGNRGHVREFCTKPSPCFMCGSDDHQANQCITGLCYNCFRPGHSKQDCPKKRCGPYCKLCNLDGHDETCCPDMWRSYLRVKSPDKIVKDVKVFCYNCASSSHFGDDCQRPLNRGLNRLPMKQFSSFISDRRLADVGYKGRNFRDESTLQTLQRSSPRKSNNGRPYSSGKSFQSQQSSSSSSLGGTLYSGGNGYQQQQQTLPQFGFEPLYGGQEQQSLFIPLQQAYQGNSYAQGNNNFQFNSNGNGYDYRNGGSYDQGSYSNTNSQFNRSKSSGNGKQFNRKYRGGYRPY